MPSNHDAGRPGQPAKRRVLRKIEPAPGTATMRPPPRSSIPSIPAPEEQAGRPLPPARTAPTTASVVTPLPAPRVSVSPSPAPAATNGVAYESVAPVTATVITPPFNTTLAPPPSPARGSLRSVVIGAALGLAIVGIFVAGTRLALRAHTPPAAAAQLPSQPAPIVPAQPPQAQQVSATTATSLAALPGVPVMAASELPLAHPAKTRGHRAWKATRGAPQAAPSAAAEPAVPGPSASAAQAPEPDPDDSAPSLVPVIPAASAPPVDPFVKAVQSDIDEENSKRR